MRVLTRHWPVTGALLAFWPGSSARAEPQARTSSRSPYEVEVRAPAAPSIPDPSANAIRVGARDLARARAQARGLDTLVDAMSGARVIDLGGPAQDKRLSVRGGTPAQTVILVDGVAVSSPFATGLDVGLIPMESLEEISVVRGGAGAVLGQGALTGALVLRTKRAEQRPSASATLGYGSLDSVVLRGAASGRGLALGIDYERSEGNFDYVSSLPGLPDEGSVRTNNDAQRGALNARYDRSLWGGEIFVNAAGALREAGVPGLETQANEVARELRGTGQARVGWRRPAVASRAGVELLAHTELMRIDYEDPQLDLESNTQFITGGGDFGIEVFAGESHLVRGRIELGFEGSSSTEYGSPGRGRTGVSISDEIDIDELVFFGALRGDLVTGQTAALLPRLGVRYTPDSRLELGVSIGRSYRAPTMDELYHPSQSGFSGNPDLSSESAWEAEIFASYSPLSELSIDASTFGRRISDGILYVNDNAFEIRPKNIGESWAVGAELDLNGQWRSAVTRTSARLGGSLLWSEVDASGEALPSSAPLALNAELALELFPKSRSSSLELFTRARYVSPTNANLSGTLKSDPYLRWDAGASVVPFAGACVSLSVINLLDEQTLESVNKIPLPGRMVLASIRVETGASEVAR